jgi:hypothetical protein
MAKAIASVIIPTVENVGVQADRDIHGSANRGLIKKRPRFRSILVDRLLSCVRLHLFKSLRHQKRARRIGVLVNQPQCELYSLNGLQQVLMNFTLR